MAYTDKKFISIKGFIYIWALFYVAIFGIVLAGTGLVWQTKVQREKEQELLFVGEQFRKAIMSYYRGSEGSQQKYPQSLQDLLLDTRSFAPKRHLRKIFLDPITKTYEWGLIKEPVSEKATESFTFMNNPGIIGVYSKSKKVPVKTNNFPESFSDFSKADSYRDWKFIFHVLEDSDQSPNNSGQPATSKRNNSLKQ